MSNSLYNKKTTKSSVFLFPLLGTSRYSAFPYKKTYIVCKERNIDENSGKLIVIYPYIDNSAWLDYENKVILINKNLISKEVIDDEIVYVFDLSYLNDTWTKFLDGKYSKFPADIKKRVMAYHVIMDTSGKKKDNRIIQEILYPSNPTQTEVDGKMIDFEDAFERYAPQLGIKPHELREVGEIYSKPDLEMEEYKNKTLQS